MRERALYYYKKGYNCSQCILKAAEETYCIKLSSQCINMCQGVNTGFGVESLCSVLVSGIMVFGLLFDEQTVKRLRIKLLDEFKTRHKDISCYSLRRQHKTGLKCEAVVCEAAELIDEIVRNEKR